MEQTTICIILSSDNFALLKEQAIIRAVAKQLFALKMHFFKGFLP